LAPRACMGPPANRAIDVRRRFPSSSSLLAPPPGARAILPPRPSTRNHPAFPTPPAKPLLVPSTTAGPVPDRGRGRPAASPRSGGPCLFRFNRVGFPGLRARSFHIGRLHHKRLILAPLRVADNGPPAVSPTARRPPPEIAPDREPRRPANPAHPRPPDPPTPEGLAPFPSSAERPDSRRVFRRPRANLDPPAGPPRAPESPRKPWSNLTEVPALPRCVHHPSSSPP